MKIILKDFIYKGHQIKNYECELVQVTEIDETFEERIVEYLKDNLDKMLK